MTGVFSAFFLLDIGIIAKDMARFAELSKQERSELRD